MQQIAGWAVALVLALIVGFAAGSTHGRNAEREMVANDCRQSGGFAYKRTGFICEVKR